VGSPLCHSDRNYEWLRDCAAHYLAVCPFLYPHVPKDASLKIYRFIEPHVNRCSRTEIIACVYLAGHLLIYLFACDARILVNSLQMSRLYLHKVGIPNFFSVQLTYDGRDGSGIGGG
jgi:hypothetical protein